MQQAYRALRILAEAQTVRMMLTSAPGALLLSELGSACAALKSESSLGLTCLVLDIAAGEQPAEERMRNRIADEVALRREAERVAAAVRAVPQPVLAVVRETPSEAASILVQAADLVLVARQAALLIPEARTGGSPERLPGEQAVMLGHATWCVSAETIDTRLEEILALLRKQSALALRNARAAVRLALRVLPPADGRQYPYLRLLTPDGLSSEHEDEQVRLLHEGRARLEALRQVNAFYLAEVMRTDDAQEGLRAFLEKRVPRWKQQSGE